MEILEDELENASCEADVNTVKFLLDRGADSALENASYSGHLEVVRLLLDRGADVHAGHERALTSASYMKAILKSSDCFWIGEQTVIRL